MKRMAKPTKKVVKKPSKSSVAARLKSPDASVSVSSFGTHSFSVSVDAQIKSGKVSAIGFETTGPDVFRSFLSRSISLFVGKSPEDLESFDVNAFIRAAEPFPEEREFVMYAWTVLQDVIARLPQKDPMSKAIHRIHQIHKDFPLGEMGIDEED